MAKPLLHSAVGKFQGRRNKKHAVRTKELVENNLLYSSEKKWREREWEETKRSSRKERENECLWQRKESKWGRRWLEGEKGEGGERNCRLRREEIKGQNVIFFCYIGGPYGSFSTWSIFNCNCAYWIDDQGRVRIELNKANRFVKKKRLIWKWYFLE